MRNGRPIIFQGADAVKPNEERATDLPTPIPAPGAGPRSEAIAGYMMQYLETAQTALIAFDASGRVLYSNMPARMLAVSLNPDKSAAELEFVSNWQAGLASEKALEACRESGSWIGKVRLDGPGLRDRVAQVRLVALGPQRSQPFMMSIRDITVEYSHEMQLHERNAELEIAYAKLKSAQEQAFRTEKLASIGQLAAGVAHEINNPIAYVKSNLNALRISIAHLLDLAKVPESEEDLRLLVRSEQLDDAAEVDADNLSTDVHDLVMESLEGVERVCKIVSDLKDFSHQDQIDNWVMADVHAGLESTLNIVWNEIKYKAHVVKSYGELPLIECIPSQLNQVFMNLLINASQAIESNGIITITTECSDDHVVIMIGDNGKGIPPETVPRIFDPFFTTKTVGEGTGLGLAISYGIISKHHGTIEVTSVPGEGTLFMLKLPVAQPR